MTDAAQEWALCAEAGVMVGGAFLALFGLARWLWGAIDEDEED